MAGFEDLVSQKRRGSHFVSEEEDSESFFKRAKMRDVNSALEDEGLTDADRFLQGVDRGPTMPDLNYDACFDHNLARNDPLSCPEDADKSSSNPEPGDGRDDKGRVAAAAVGGFDLNAEDVCSSAINDPFHPYKFPRQLKYSDAFECGSSTGPVEDKDPMQKWKEMKQNGFFSPSYGGIPAPKQRGRKSKHDALKKRMELAKKEQVDRFTKLAAPTGLLHGLNPGIINHVRNTKQVHSIIKALVRSEEEQNRHIKGNLTDQGRGGAREFSDKSKESGKGNSSGAPRPSLSHELAPFHTMSGKQMHGNNFLLPSSTHSSGGARGQSGDCGDLERRIHSKAPFSSNIGTEDIVGCRLSSAANVVSKVTSSASNFSVDASSVDSLSTKAAAVASQWLQLLKQDIEGRLTALRRSRKRVQAVMNTELPLMLKKEFLSDQENELCIARGFPLSSNKVSEFHQAHWGILFSKMDKALSEEEKQLECWLKQVEKMWLHCEHGLQQARRNFGFGLHQMGVESHARSEMDEAECEKALKAAAASMYSTCKFLLSKENVTCC